MSEPRQFSDSELLMYNDGELDEATARAIRQSPAALARAAQLAQSEAKLRTVLFQATRPDTTVLGEYLLGLLDREESAVVAHYLAQNPLVQAEVDQLQAFLGMLSPAAGSRPAVARVAAKVRELVARLIDDLSGALDPGGGPQLALAGLRGQADGPLQFAAAEYEVSLDLQADDQRRGALTIIGLILGGETSGWWVSLEQNGELRSSEKVDALGNFTLAGVAPGRYTLRLGDEQTVIHIEQLDVA